MQIKTYLLLDAAYKLWYQLNNKKTRKRQFLYSFFFVQLKPTRYVGAPNKN